MKNLILILLFPVSMFGQSCPPGRSWMPSISTGDIAIIADKCLLDDEVKDMWRIYFKSLCPEPPPQVLYTNYRVTKGTVWVNDTLGCQPIEKYEKKVNGNWIPVTKCLWYWENKTRLKCYGGVTNDIQVPCCGHFHKTKPN